MRTTRALLAGIVLFTAAPALAQSAMPFGGLKHDSSQQVEVSADSLRVDQTSGSATFAGISSVRDEWAVLVLPEESASPSSSGSKAGRDRRTCRPSISIISSSDTTT